MNFNTLVIFSLLLLTVNCGVKGNPTSPTSQKLPSVLDNYPDIEVDQPLNDTDIKRK